MSRTGVAKPNDFTDPDQRFPFPHSDTPTRCQKEPSLFDFEHGERGRGRAATEKQLRKARAACSGCPLVTDCLRWALVNEDATRVGIWAATTPRQRIDLRKRMKDRLGPDWVDVLAAQEQARRDQTEAARHRPLTVAQARIVRMDREANGPMPLRLPLTPEQQQRNRARLVAGLTAA